MRDSETSIDFVQGPPGSRRERVKMHEGKFDVSQFYFKILFPMKVSSMGRMVTKYV